MFGERAAAVGDVLDRARALTRLARVHAQLSGSCSLCPRLQPSASALLRAEPRDEACQTALDVLRLFASQTNEVERAAAFATRLEAAFAAQTACVAAVRGLHAELATPSAPSDPFANHLRSIAVYGAGADDPEVRVVLAFDEEVQFRTSELAAPRRIVFDFDRAQPARELPRELAVGKAGLSRIQSAAPDAHTARVSFEVAPSLQYRLFYLPQPYRLVIDFAAGQTAEQPDAAIDTIVLDPGHGGVQAGARAPSGLAEAEVALDIAQRVRRVLARTLPRPRVVLTRERDQFVSLEERTAIANALGADLFVSIHLNASPVPDDRGGVSTHVLDVSHDPQTSGLAARENEAANSNPGALVPWVAPLVRREQVAHSLDLAQAVHRAVLRNGRRMLPNLADRGVKSALFYVLVGARMPAILCEASFLTRREEAEALATDAYRQLLAAGIATGIARYVWRTEGAQADSP